MPQAGAPHAEAEYLLPCMLCSLYIASFRCLTKNEMPKVVELFCVSRPLDRLRAIATTGRTRHFDSNRHVITPEWSASQKLLVPSVYAKIADALVEAQIGNEMSASVL